MTAYDPDLARRLCAEAVEDDERMTGAPWSDGVAGACNLVHFDGDDIRGVANVFANSNRDAIARTRNNLAALVSQLHAASLEIGRLTECLAVADADRVPLKANVWYMHDNHTFTRIRGDMTAVIEQARRLGVESKYGMLGSVILLGKDDKEIRRAGIGIHARADGFTETDLAAWRKAALADSDVMRLLATKDHGDEQ